MIKNHILTIIGPTASGKTTLAVAIAKLIKGEIIGLDSRQIYKNMLIGTAQPTEEEMDDIPHHLFGIRDPSEPISAGEYAKLVCSRIKKIQAIKKKPIVCGGSGLYYYALKKGIFEGSFSDLPTRRQLEQAYEKDPVSLLDRLKTIDPNYAKIVHINNKKRLVRALEIYRITGKSPSDHFAQQEENLIEFPKLFTVLLNWDRKQLVNRIAQRTDEMLKDGWIEEVQVLIEKQNQFDNIFPALDSIGYRQIQSYLKNEISYDQMREEIIIKTRQFSRRQMQWFKKENIDLFIEMDELIETPIAEIIYDLII